MIILDYIIKGAIAVIVVTIAVCVMICAFIGVREVIETRKINRK